jgi:hypothetical protein
MATLTTGSTLLTVADILRSAAAVGHESWQTGIEGARVNPPGPASNPVPEPSLSRDLIDLFTMLAARKSRYLLVGGVALLRYIEGRNTDDIDLLLSVESLAKLPEIQVLDRNADFARGVFRSLRVDVLLSQNPVFSHVLQHHATTHRFREVEVPCATVEGLVVLKLYALPSLYRQGDLQRAALYESDITMLVQRYRTPLPPILDTLRPHLDPGQVDELANIAKEIEQRVARMERTPKQ